MTLQSAVLAVGAYLVIHQEATAALSSQARSERAGAGAGRSPIAHWKGFVAARQSWHRLNGCWYPAAAVTPSSCRSVEGSVGRGCQHRAAGRSKVIVQEVTSHSRPAADWA